MARKRSTRRRSSSAGQKLTTTDVIPNQVFVGLPWSSRTRWDHVIDRMRVRSPLSLVVVGRNDRQDAEDLLAVIKERIDSSSYGVFDATAGNPNVSLEYGYAEAIDLPRVLYLSTHGHSRRTSKDAPIIADLAGKRRNQFKQEKGLKRLLAEFSNGHAYTVRFERFMQSTFKRVSAGKKKRARALALKVIHRLDGSLQVRRADIVQQLQGDVARYTEQEIDTMIKRLHRAKLIRSQQGPHARVQIV
jgi:hypothetical protein